MPVELVSVIIPVYNASRFLSQTIESVLTQTYASLEIIIIDDCSTDNSLQIAQEYAEIDQRIRVIASGKNQGVAKSRNLGISEARGKYIALLDSDDLWVATKIERQIGLMKKTEADIVYCSYDFIDENGNSILKPFVVPEYTNYKKMLTSSVISCSSAFIRTNVLAGHVFNPAFYHEDYVLWMELLSIPLKAVGDTGILMHYRQVAGSRSNNKMHAACQRWKVYRRVMDIGRIRSAALFVVYAFKGLKKYYKK